MLKIPLLSKKVPKPITDIQYESLANEMLVKLNRLASPQIFEADFIGAIFANAIHSVELKGGYQRKSKILDVMIDLIAKRLSFEISEGIRHKKEAEAKAKSEQVTEDLPSAVNHSLQAVPDEEQAKQ
jgi:hypothetical protein